MLEFIVALAVFIVVAVISLSIFVSVIRLQTRILSQQDFTNQITYIMEYSSRMIRNAVPDVSGNCLGASYAGYSYRATRPYQTNPDGFFHGIKFVSKDGVCEEIFIDTNDNNYFKESRDGTAQNILSSRVSINYVRFVLDGDRLIDKASDSYPTASRPRVTMIINATVPVAGENQQKSFQTTISQLKLQ